MVILTLGFPSFPFTFAPLSLFFDRISGKDTKRDETFYQVLGVISDVMRVLR